MNIGQEENQSSLTKCGFNGQAGRGGGGPTFNIILTILNSATYLKIFCMQQLDMYHLFMAVHCAAGSDHFVDLQCLACDRDRDCDALFCCIEKG